MKAIEVAEWHRKEAKKHQDLASFHKRTADTLEAEAKQDSDMGPIASSVDKTLTLEQFESALATRGGRVVHVANRLGVPVTVIHGFLNDPKCKYEIGDRGFIYPKQ